MDYRTLSRTGLYAAAFILPAILGRAQAPTIAAIVNAASFSTGPVAPGGLTSLLGSNLGDATVTTCTTNPVPTSCGVVSVLFNGKATPLILVSASQINFQVPVEVTGTAATVQVTRQTGGQTLQSAVTNVAIAPTAPGLFGLGTGLGAFLNSSSAIITASNPAQPGETVTIYGTGFGATNPVVNSGNAAPTTGAPALVVAPVKITVGGRDATVVIAALVPGDFGLDQVIFKVPQGLPGGNLPVVANVGGRNSQPVLLPVAQPNVSISGVSNNASDVYVAPLNYFGSPGASRPAQPGETVLIYGTGFGPTTPAVAAGQIFADAAPLADPAQLHIRIGGVPATVQFAGLVAAGEYQFNVLIPVLPDGDQPIVADIGGVNSQSGLLITIRN